MSQVLFYCPSCSFSKKIAQSDIPTTAKQCKCPSCKKRLNLSEAIQPLNGADSLQQSAPSSAQQEPSGQAPAETARVQSSRLSSMLHMRCPECKKSIASVLLSELEEVICNHCQAIVPVNDLTVTANGFTYYCADLKKRLSHYKSLLKNFSIEQKQLEQDPQATKERKRNLEKSIEGLKAGMASARDNCRIHFDDELFLQYRFETQMEIGKLVNISMYGACIESMPSATAPHKDTPLTIMFSLPGKEHVFSIGGTIRWINNGLFGISFKSVNPEDGALLWQHIATLALGYVPQATLKDCAYAV